MQVLPHAHHRPGLTALTGWDLPGSLQARDAGD